MNRLIAIAPVALLTSACAVRTPASALDAQDVDQGSSHMVALPSEVEAIAAWQLPPASPWSRYEKLTLLTYLTENEVAAAMPDVAKLDVVSRAEAAAARVAAAGLPSDTMWIVDLRGAASVAFGATLSRLSNGRVAPVLTFNNWPASNEVVPAEQTLAALVSMRPAPLDANAPATPVFLLDAWRLAFREAEPDPDAVDNRYLLLSSDFPDSAMLRSRGITRVIYVVEDRGESGMEEDDVHEVVLDYERAGIDLALVDLRELADLGDGVVWGGCFAQWSFHVRPRATIFNDARFYTRARGGFGPYGGTGAFGGGRAYSGASPHVGQHGGG